MTVSCADEYFYDGLRKQLSIKARTIKTLVMYVDEIFIIRQNGKKELEDLKKN